MLALGPFCAFARIGHCSPVVSLTKGLLLYFEMVRSLALERGVSAAFIIPVTVNWVQLSCAMASTADDLMTIPTPEDHEAKYKSRGRTKIFSCTRTKLPNRHRLVLPAPGYDRIFTMSKGCDPGLRHEVNAGDTEHHLLKDSTTAFL